MDLTKVLTLYDECVAGIADSDSVEIKIVDYYKFNRKKIESNKEKIRSYLKEYIQLGFSDDIDLYSIIISNNHFNFLKYDIIIGRLLALGMAAGYVESNNAQIQSDIVLKVNIK